MSQWDKKCANMRHKLYISSIHEAVKSSEKIGFYVLGKNFLKDVDIMGIITEITEHHRSISNKFLVIRVDDGTGVICCKYNCGPTVPINENEMKMKEECRVIWKNVLRRSTLPFQMKIGDTIHAQGIISEFRGKKELKVEKIRLIKNVNEESHRVFELEALYKSVYELK